MDKRKSILNVAVSVGTKLLAMVMVIVVRRFLIQYCGNEVNGLNALYLSIIGFVSVAELGIGSAITFSMYKPIVENDMAKVSALYGLFKRLYWIIGSVILGCGLILAPFLHVFAKDYTQLDVNLSYTFILMLISVVMTYVFGAKMALFNAHKNNYVTTAITQGGLLIQYMLQIVALITFGTFEAYLICRIVSCLVQWLVTEFLVNKQYRTIVTTKQVLDGETRREVTKNIKAMFMHNIGYVLVNTLDSVVIATFVGVVVLGEYSNYTTILASITGMLKLVFSSLTSILGHMYVKEDKKVAREYAEAFYFLNFVIGTVFFLGYYAIIDNLIAILFSESLVVAKSISFVITLNGFVQFMRTSTLSFRDATGTFYYDRWKPLVEGVFNVVFSILFVRQFGVVGVIVATIGTNLLICHIVEPYVIYKFAFEESPKKYYIKNYLCIFVFVVSMMIIDRSLMNFESQWIELFANGTLSVLVSAVVCLVVFPVNKKAVRRLMKIKEKH